MNNQLPKVLLTACLLGINALTHAANPLAFSEERTEAGLAKRLRIDIRDYSMQIAGTGSARKLQTGAASLMRMGERLPSTDDLFAILSAGFSRNDPLEPSGGLVEDYGSYSPWLDKPGVLSGALCMDVSGRPFLLEAEEFQDSRSRCAWAVQAGPFVVERNGQQAISEKSSPAAAARLVACQPKGEANRFFDFYYFDRANLRDIEESLRDRCGTALNLTGSIQAGMTLWRGQRLTDAVGRSDTPLPSVILVSPRVDKNRAPAASKF